MSTIVVVKKNGTAVIAADTRFSSGSTSWDAKYNAAPEKIHRFGDTFIGLVGSAAHHDVIESILEKHPGELSFVNRRHIFETYLKLHCILKAEFFIRTDEDDKSQPYDSSQMDGLIANPHGIFGMFSYREVDEYERFWAIGSGKQNALGALFASFDRLESAEEIARIAVAAAAEFDQGTSLPLTLYSVKLLATPTAT